MLRGMATKTRRRFGRIRVLPSGRFQVRYRTPDGVEHTAPATFETKTAAGKFLSTIETDISRGAWVDHRLGKETIESWGKRYMATTGHLKPSSRQAQDSLFRTVIVPTLGKIPVGQLRSLTVRKWVSDLDANGMSASRIRQAFGLLSQMMGVAEQDGLIPVTPCRNVSLPRLPEAQPVILTAAQVAAIAGKMPGQYPLLVNLLAYMGLRVGEAYALRRRSVDPLQGHLVISESITELATGPTLGTPKTHQQRTLTLPAWLLVELETHLEGLPAAPDTLLFVNKNGNMIRHSNFTKSYWRKAVAELGLVGVTPHDLRATHASWVIDGGGSVLDAAARLGHASSSVTTRHYARPAVGRDADVAARLSAPKSVPAETDRARSGHGQQKTRLKAAP